LTRRIEQAFTGTGQSGSSFQMMEAFLRARGRAGRRRDFRYPEPLSAALSFDPALAQRARQEVEDHLKQAVAADLSNAALRLSAVRSPSSATGRP
jgi:hypothetical protein